jgi:hypothetical protein
MKLPRFIRMSKGSMKFYHANTGFPRYLWLIRSVILDHEDFIRKKYLFFD